jgi:hypothetical protein
MKVAAIIVLLLITKHRLVYPLTEQEIIRVGPSPKRGCQMRLPTERDQCRAKLDILIEGFIAR